MRRQEGFTLIEMLVVVAVVGLLSSVVVVGLSGARAKARDARRVADVRQIQNELETLYTDADGYPESGDGTGDTIHIPDDPQGNPYQYVRTESNFSYELGIGLENSENDNFSDGDCPAAIAAAPAFCVAPE